MCIACVVVFHYLQEHGKGMELGVNAKNNEQGRGKKMNSFPPPTLPAQSLCLENGKCYARL